MNPLVGMMKGAMGGMMGGGMNPMGQGSGMTGMFGRIRQFAALVGRRNPQQMVRALMQQKGIPESALQEAMKEAQSIANEMGLR